MAGFEGADHLNGHGRALDMVQASGHLDRLDEDYAALARLGLRSVRESIGWRLAEAPSASGRATDSGSYDFSRACRMALSAQRHGLQILWSLMHYGTPADVDLRDERFVGRFARFAAAAARALRPYHDTAPVYTPVNEISFLAWALTETGLMQPYASQRHHAEGSSEGSSRASGWEMKCRLVKATLAAMEAILDVDPRARFLHVEPVVHVVPPVDRPELAALAEEVRGYQWQAWDLIAGRLEPQLGGHPGALDLIGVNHYHSGQWEVATEKRLHWHLKDPRRAPFADLLTETWQRYRRPLIVAETSHVGSGRAQWLDEMAAEVQRARSRGVPVDGLCLYPIVDRPDWEDARHWHHSGMWDACDPDQPTPSGLPHPVPRRLNRPYARCLRRWQRRLPSPGPTPSDQPPGAAMTDLIVFSHLRWDFVYQRPQHLLSRLARHHRVWFIEEPVHHNGPSYLQQIDPCPNVHVLRPHTPVADWGFADSQIPELLPLVQRHLQLSRISDYVVWLYTPMALPLLQGLHPRAVIYDCMDELSAFKGAPRELGDRERELMRRADVVLTGGPSLFEAKRHLHPHVYCLPSAVDARHYSPVVVRRDQTAQAAARSLHDAMPQPRVGFFGVIDERMDLELVDAMAAGAPDWSFVMVGPVVKIDPASLPRRPNLHWLGQRDYRDLPHLASQWDVCMLPFALNEHTRFISPTKTLEYMAAEKPVISTPVHDVIELYGDVVHIARDAAGMLAACRELLAETPAQRAERINAMLLHVMRGSWDARADQVRALIQQALDRHAPALPATPVAATAHAAPAKPRLMPTTALPATAGDRAWPQRPAPLAAAAVLEAAHADAEDSGLGNLDEADSVLDGGMDGGLAGDSAPLPLRPAIAPALAAQATRPVHGGVRR